MDKYEAKQAYVDKIMSENAEIETLTEEQHDTLEWLCSTRHEIHSSWNDMWNPESSSYTRLQYCIDDYCGSCTINERLIAVGLDPITFPDMACCPSEDDYFQLDDDEREEWDDLNNWKENSGNYELFCNIMSRVNNIIEDYLRKIDKKHGTNYCPTGMARLKYFYF